MPEKDWLILSILTFVISLVWITLEVYHSYSTSVIDPLDIQLAQPLTPQFDHKTIIKLIEENKGNIQ